MLQDHLQLLLHQEVRDTQRGIQGDGQVCLWSLLSLTLQDGGPSGSQSKWDRISLQATLNNKTKTLFFLTSQYQTEIFETILVVLYESLYFQWNLVWEGRPLSVRECDGMCRMLWNIEMWMFRLHPAVHQDVQAQQGQDQGAQVPHRGHFPE